MAQHLIDKPLRLAVCTRCTQPILVGMSSGIRVAVDPVKHALADVAKLTLAGRGCYDLVRQVPQRIGAARLNILRDHYPQGKDVLADHGCGTAHLSAEMFEEAERPPHQAPASSGRPHGAAMDVPGSSSGTTNGSRADSATLHRSDAAARCHDCRGLIPEGGDRIQVLIPQWQENEFTVPNRGTRKGSTRIISGWGWERWVIHPDGCPASTGGRT